MKAACFAWRETGFIEHVCPMNDGRGPVWRALAGLLVGIPRQEGEWDRERCDSTSVYILPYMHSLAITAWLSECRDFALFCSQRFCCYLVSKLWTVYSQRSSQLDGCLEKHIIQERSGIWYRFSLQKYVQRLYKTWRLEVPNQFSSLTARAILARILARQRFNHCNNIASEDNCAQNWNQAL